MKICTCVCQFGSAKVVIIIGKIKKKIEYYDIPTLFIKLEIAYYRHCNSFPKNNPYFFRIDFV